MIVMSVCSLMVNAPGFNAHSIPNVVKVRLGMYFPHKFPMGYATNWAISVDTEMEGVRIEKRMLRPDPVKANMLPNTQTRIVSCT